jgi:DNA-binding LytR/AlgR family response regulator
MKATALIAEDEPLLAAELEAQLLRLWPEIDIVASVADGISAVEEGLALQPDLLFLDIQMPGMTGFDVARALAEDWPSIGKPFPVLVFVTAYDQYALEAFEHAAIDYVLKPVQTERLKTTCQRLQAVLLQRAAPKGPPPAWGTVIGQLRELFDHTAATPVTPPLRIIQASTGNRISMIPVSEVLFFEAADKYVRVVTSEQEHLIRTSLRELGAQLDPQCFWQVHRRTIVRSDAIESAVRDASGKVTLSLRGYEGKLSVSRLYADLFKAM